MLAKVFSGAIIGLDAVPIEVEVDIANQGLPSFTIVGLPDKAVEEAKERVRSAIKNSGADLPSKRITVNLAPADLPKEGPSYDLPIALGILLASEQIKGDFSKTIVTGELALDGRIRSVNGILPLTIMAANKQFSHLIFPSANEREASIIQDINLYPLTNLLELLNHIARIKLISPAKHTDLNEYFAKDNFEYDMKDIKGQNQAKRAMEIAAAGGHNVLLKGPPGAGKTLLARTLPSILPSLSFDEAIEVTKIYSIAGLLTSQHVITKRPFRSPHHTTSLVGVIGGSSNPRPGELTLAHRGVLFLDEFPEFPRNILEALRQPLEDGFISIARANGKITFPTKCMLIAAQNPCPCGYFGDTTHTCSCTSSQIIRYRKKISGPILDRIDIHLEIPAVKTESLTKDNIDVEDSSTIRSRVQNARGIQLARFYNLSINNNAEMNNKQTRIFCELTPDCTSLLQRAVSSLNLSARSYYRILRLSRTIADLEGSEKILLSHVAESLQYRPRIQA